MEVRILKWGVKSLKSLMVFFFFVVLIPMMAMLQVTMVIQIIG